MSPHSKKIGAVILAAGGSSRFGEPKQLLQFRGQTLIRRAINAACQAGCSPVVVVTGSAPEKVRRAVHETNAVVVQNEQWQRGIGSSIRCGIQALINSDENVEASVLLVCDQPAVDVGVIEHLIALRKADGKSIVASSYADTLGVPAIFDSSFFLNLLSLPDEAGAKRVILEHRAHVAEFVFPQGAIDIDTQDDWGKFSKAGHPEE